MLLVVYVGKEGRREGGREVFWGLGRILDCLYYGMQVRCNTVK